MFFDRVTTWMITTQEVIVSFIFPTCWAISTMTGILTMDNVTNWEDAVRPLDEEGRSFAGFTTTELGVILPINVTHE